MRHARTSCWVLFIATSVALCAFEAGAQFRVKPDKDAEDRSSDRERDLDRFRDEADEVLSPLTGQGLHPGQGEGEAQAYWSIVLVAFTGDNQAALAQAGLRRVVGEAGVTGATLEKRDKATVIAYGRYDGPEDPSAVADLAWLRTLRVGGQAPFASALLSPPSPSQLTGSLPELDLRNAKKIFGEDRALYTLQVAIYGRGDRSRATPGEVAENRRAAEKAAILLRRDGELAFYYHAPERSMVTVGVFGQEDHDPLNRPGIESFELMQVRERHPLNLLNGQGIRERIPGVRSDGPEAYRLQSSKLVGIPEG